MLLPALSLPSEELPLFQLISQPTSVTRRWQILIDLCLIIAPKRFTSGVTPLAGSDHMLLCIEIH